MFIKSLGIALLLVTIAFLGNIVLAGGTDFGNDVAVRMDIDCNDSFAEDMEKKNMYDPAECKTPLKAVVLDDRLGMPIATVLFFGWLLFSVLVIGKEIGEHGAHRERDEEEEEEVKEGSTEQPQST